VRSLIDSPSILDHAGRASTARMPFNDFPQLAALIANAVAHHRSRRKPKAEHTVTARAPRRRPAATSKGRPSKAAMTTPTTAHHRSAPPVRHKKR